MKSLDRLSSKSTIAPRIAILGILGAALTSPDATADESYPMAVHESQQDIRVRSQISRQVTPERPGVLTADQIRTIQDMLDDWIASHVATQRSWDESTLRNQLDVIARKISYEMGALDGRDAQLSLLLQSVIPEGKNMKVTVRAAWNDLYRSAEFFEYRTTQVLVTESVDLSQFAAPRERETTFNAISYCPADDVSSFERIEADRKARDSERFRKAFTEFLQSLREDDLFEGNTEMDGLMNPQEQYIFDYAKKDGPQFNILPHNEHFVVELGDALGGRTRLERGMDRTARRQGKLDSPDSLERTQFMVKLRFFLDGKRSKRGAKRSMHSAR